MWAKQKKLQTHKKNRKSSDNIKYDVIYAWGITFSENEYFSHFSIEKSKQTRKKCQMGKQKIEKETKNEKKNYCKQRITTNDDFFAFFECKLNVALLLLLFDFHRLLDNVAAV